MRAQGLLLGLSLCVGADAADAEAPQSFSRWPQQRMFNEFKAGKKVQIVLDPSRYRSSSQGPIMKDELASGRPISVDDLHEIDDVIDRCTRTDGWNPIIPQYSGRRAWAWTQWHGTIVERLVRPFGLAVLVPVLLMIGVHLFDPTVPWFHTPDEAHKLIKPLLAVSNGWSYLLTLTTFVTTFFVGHSHAFWRKSYGLTRVVQGRLNDLNLLCCAHAARLPDGNLTPEARQLLKDMSRDLRLAHILFWSDVCYRRSVDFGASIRVLLTTPALDRMHERGLLDAREHEALMSSDLPPSRWYMVVIEWITARLAHAHRCGTLVGGEGFAQTALEKCCELRGACMSIPDELAARMPLAYVHMTHLLVDVLLFLAPFALYPKLGAFAAPLNGIIALFYRGLLELSKSFLDPFGNRRVSDSSLSADIGIATLIGETNAGSIVWPQGAERLPFRFNATGTQPQVFDHASVLGRGELSE